MNKKRWELLYEKRTYVDERTNLYTFSSHNLNGCYFYKEHQPFTFDVKINDWKEWARGPKAVSIPMSLFTDYIVDAIARAFFHVTLVVGSSSPGYVDSGTCQKSFNNYYVHGIYHNARCEKLTKPAIIKTWAQASSHKKIKVGKEWDLLVTHNWVFNKGLRECQSSRPQYTSWFEKPIKQSIPDIKDGSFLDGSELFTLPDSPKPLVNKQVNLDNVNTDTIHIGEI